MRAKATSSKVVIAALAGNLAIALTKAGAAWFTGSAAMLSEAVHSAVDSVNELLLLYGLHRAARPPSDEHPFGHGRELYFWSFIVALLVFALGACVSLYEGIVHLRNPVPIEHPGVSYFVLGVSFVLEGTSWWIAMREFRAAKGDRGWFEAFRRSKDPTAFTVLFEDSAALAGLAMAFLGTLGSQWLGQPRLDGVASICIAVVLAIASLFLARESKALLIGEAAHSHVRRAILEIATADTGIRRANGVLTAQIGRDEVIAALSAEFEDHLRTPEVEACVNRIEEAIKARHPEVSILFVKPQTPETWRQRIAEHRSGGQH